MSSSFQQIVKNFTASWFSPVVASGGFLALAERQTGNQRPEAAR